VGRFHYKQCWTTSNITKNSIRDRYKPISKNRVGGSMVFNCDNLHQKYTIYFTRIITTPLSTYIIIVEGFSKHSKDCFGYIDRVIVTAFVLLYYWVNLLWKIARDFTVESYIHWRSPTIMTWLERTCTQKVAFYKSSVEGLWKHEKLTVRCTMYFVLLRYLLSLHTLDDNFLFGFCKNRTLNHKFSTECGRWQNINLFIYMCLLKDCESAKSWRVLALSP
jgi:hypothetical protein